MLTKLCAIVSGLAAGGFLFFRYSRLLTHNFSALTWYEAALLFTGLGLAGLYPRAWLGAVLSTALAVFLGVRFQVYLDLSRNPKCCNLWPLAFVMWFFLGLPAPLIGGVIGYTISFKRVPRLLFLILLASGLGIGLCLPLTQQNGYRRIGTKEIPALLARIYEAEISYNAKRADKSFNAAGTSYRRHENSGGSPAPPTALDEQPCQAVCTPPQFPTARVSSRSAG